MTELMRENLNYSTQSLLIILETLAIIVNIHYKLLYIRKIKM